LPLPLTRDPIRYAGGINLYAYCGNNPVNLVDPLGLCSGGGGSGFDWRHPAAVRDTGSADDSQWHTVQEYDFRVRLTSNLGGPLVGLGSAITATVNLAAGPAAAVVATGEDAAVTGAGEALLNAEPTGSALKVDVYHRSATWAREAAAQTGTHSTLVGGDGTMSTITQIPGGLNGVSGRFEYIVDSTGRLTHQRFVPGGTINGVPNIP